MPSGSRKKHTFNDAIWFADRSKVFRFRVSLSEFPVIHTKKKNSNNDTLIEKDHLGDWSPEKALDSEDHFRIPGRL